MTGCDQKVPFRGVPSLDSLSTGSSSKHPSRCVSMATEVAGHCMMWIALPAGMAVKPSSK